MGKFEKEDLRNVTKAYTDEELNIVVKVIPDDYLWDELIRRDAAMLEKINAIETVLGVSLDNITPIPVKAWEDIRNRYTDLRDKFSKIRKGIGK